MATIYEVEATFDRGTVRRYRFDRQEYADALLDAIRSGWYKDEKGLKTSSIDIRCGEHMDEHVAINPRRIVEVRVTHFEEE